MKKKIMFFILCLVLISLYVYAQDDMETIDNAAFKNPQRPPAVFVHDQHNEEARIDDCAICHHSYDDEGNLIEGESSEDASCSDCHSQKAEGKTKALMDAFHSRCIDCHEESKEGPITCGECHKNP